MNYKRNLSLNVYNSSPISLANGHPFLKKKKVAQLEKPQKTEFSIAEQMYAAAFIIRNRFRRGKKPAVSLENTQLFCQSLLSVITWRRALW